MPPGSAVRHRREDAARLRAAAAKILSEGQAAEAVKLAKAWAEANDRDDHVWELLAVASFRAGDAAGAVAAMSRALVIDPRPAARHANLGVFLKAQGEVQKAEAAYREAIARDASFAPAHHNLGNLLHEAGHLAEAAQSFARAVALRADYAEAWQALGVCRQKLRAIPEAIEALTRACALAPRNAQALSDLGTCHMAAANMAEAYECFRQAIVIDDTLAAARGNLAALLVQQGHLIAAEREGRAAVALAPSEHRWISNLAGVLKDLCRFEEAERLYRHALALRPDYATGHSNLLFCLNYDPRKSGDEIFAEYRRFDAAHALPHASAHIEHQNERASERRLRIGYLSPDFREHSARHFIEPMLANHNHKAFEIVCYAEVERPDATTERLQHYADLWRSTVGLSDAEVARQIRDDGIDILIDLGGHTAASRLLVLAHRPAPIQIAHFLGHGTTSGLTAADVFLADAELAPEGAEAVFSERIIRLDRIPIAYQAPHGMPPIAPLPALRNGYITFGYFGRPERLNDDVIAAWSTILHQVPDSRLRLNTKAFQETAFRTVTLARFARHGIAADRLDLVFTTPQPDTWDDYGNIDIALDPFPHNAGTTTIEALWLGVPSVSLKARPSVGRFGATILNAVDLNDWVASSIDAYVAIAVEKAFGAAELAALRAGLRDRFMASPLYDAKGCVATIERQLRALWRQYCGCAEPVPTVSESQRQLDRAPDQQADQRAAAMAHDIAGRLADAEKTLRPAIEANVHDVTARIHLSDVCRRSGKLDDAERYAREALAYSSSPEAANVLGNALAARGRPAEAEAAYGLAIASNPKYAEAFNNRALSYMRRGQYALAERDLRAALSLRPDLADIGFNIATALGEQGRIEEAIDTFRATMARLPDHAVGRGMMLFTAGYDPRLSERALYAEFKDWNTRLALPLAPRNPIWPNDRTPGRKLRIAYISAEFASKSARHFIEPMIASHDRNKFEVWCYGDVLAPDGHTERFQKLADQWRSTVGLSDEALAYAIRNDQIDIVIDLGGHTARNRLLALARKPAPVQIAHFLGHGYTSGLTVMDAFLADDRLAPTGTDELFSEPVIRLPRIPIAYLPPPEMPRVSALPARSAGAITFGYFGRVVRLNDSVVDVWSRILHGVPGSRLVLNALPFSDEAVRKRYLDLFARRGIAGERLQLIFTTPQTKTWDAYATIDIALDPFPHSGGTTTIEALWMGVPVLSLKSRAPLGRFGDSILSAAGLTNWIADNADAYVAQAIGFASDIDALERLRSSLRARVAASPLCDAAGLTRILETTYTTLWQRYCDGEAAIDGLQAAAAQAYTQGRHAEAVDLFQAALAKARRADILSNLGAALRAAGRASEAEAAYREAIERDPASATAWHNLGNLYLGAGRLADAEANLRQATTLAPNDAEALSSLAVVLIGRQKLHDAEPILRHAMAIAPANGAIRDSLAQVLRQTGRVMEALLEYQSALPLITAMPRALNNMAVVLQELCDFKSAARLYRQALTQRRDYALAHANLLFCLNYDPDLSAEEIYTEYRRYDETMALPHRPAVQRYENTPDPSRRLRVGYLSPDFRNHSARHFIEPILAHHDRSVVEIYCYAEVAEPDHVTKHFQSLADNWRSTVGLSDAGVAELIRKDQIDVLVDLGGHTSSSRVLVMARKPAPLQVAHFLGHGTTSGLSAIDAFLADDDLAPEGSDALFAESVERLGRIPLAYTPPQGMPDLAPLPALRNGYVTFAHFGRPERLNDRVIAAWSAILARVPQSRLTLNSKAFSEAAYRDWMAARFAQHGIGADRLNLMYTSPQPTTWAAYGEVDIGLDPFPHNAGTTTIEALWLGVPVITLRDRPSVGRLGASILKSVNLDGLVADDVEGYIHRAASLAADLPTLKTLRAGLRGRFLASPLADGAGLTRAMEGVYRRLWRSFVAENVPELQSAVTEFHAGRFAEALRIAEHRILADGTDADALHICALALYMLGRASAAAPIVLQSVALNPQRADWRWNATSILRSAGRLADAEREGLAAIALAPNAPEAHNNLASVLKDLGRVGEAEARYRTAIALRPSYADAWSNLSWCLAASGRGIEAEQAARRAIDLAGTDANAWNNLGTALLHQDRLSDAGQAFAEAVRLKPSFDAAHSNYLFCLNYRSDLTAEAIAAAYRGWETRHVVTLERPSSYGNVRDPHRRLRIGYVSADFRNHAASYFIEPMIAAHDRSAFEVFLYADVANADAVTERYKTIADAWRPVTGLSHNDVADLVLRDSIDVLIDLSGHTAGNRLLAFARRPAPVQIAHMIGAGTTTGLSVFNAFLADENLIPHGFEHLFSEPIERLSRIPLIYRPPAGMPDVAELPALQRGYVTFGCFSRTARINDDVVAVWSRILSGVPGAQLILNAKPFQEAETVSSWQSKFAQQGVGADRLRLVYTSPQPKTWAAYGDIDIALDPFPHNAGTTTIEALWMGVPVVSLMARPPVGRFGAMILNSLDLNDWVTASHADYVDRAIEAASDVAGLARLRRQLRARFVASPLGGDAAHLTGAVEAVYRRLWQRYCSIGP